MGGRIAEEMTFGEITTGAQNDIEQATEMARKMVCEWGMSDTLGPLTYGKKEEAIFLGKEFNRHQDYSEATALKIDAEIKRIVTEQYERAHKILTDEAPSSWCRWRRRCSSTRCWTGRSCEQILAGKANEPRAAKPVAAAPVPVREAKVEEGERAGGLLPPPMAAPKPTS